MNGALFSSKYMSLIDGFRIHMNRPFITLVTLLGLEGGFPVYSGTQALKLGCYATKSSGMKYCCLRRRGICRGGDIEGLFYFRSTLPCHYFSSRSCCVLTLPCPYFNFRSCCDGLDPLGVSGFTHNVVISSARYEFLWNSDSGLFLVHSSRRTDVCRGP